MIKYSDLLPPRMVPTTCVQCGARGRTFAESDAVIHKTIVCERCQEILKAEKEKNEDETKKPRSSRS